MRHHSPGSEFRIYAVGSPAQIHQPARSKGPQKPIPNFPSPGAESAQQPARQNPHEHHPAPAPPPVHRPARSSTFMRSGLARKSTNPPGQKAHKSQFQISHPPALKVRNNPPAKTPMSTTRPQRPRPPTARLGVPHLCGRVSLANPPTRPAKRPAKANSNSPSPRAEGPRSLSLGQSVPRVAPGTIPKRIPKH